jgi:hypothetical protein
MHTGFLLFILSIVLFTAITIYGDNTNANKLFIICVIKLIFLII